jgi:hypothetical protein
MATDIKERGIEFLSPIWNMRDLTPQGRGDWYAKLAYPNRPRFPRSDFACAEANCAVVESGKLT